MLKQVGTGCGIRYLLINVNPNTSIKSGLPDPKKGWLIKYYLLFYGAILLFR